MLAARMIGWIEGSGSAAAPAASRAAPRNACISDRDLRAADAGRKAASGQLRQAGAAARHASMAQSQAIGEHAAAGHFVGVRHLARMAISLGTRLSAGGSDSSRPSV